jgi:hypothetical protein
MSKELDNVYEIKNAIKYLKGNPNIKEDSYSLEALYYIDQALTEFEKLKERDTPIKLTQASRFTTDKRLYGMYACSSCHQVIPYITLNSKRVKPKFCYHCGQRLDWSNEKGVD